MNFFGHGCLAAETRPDAAFVVGAMLPDLAAMAGLRVTGVAHAAADDGRRFHYATDAAFHRAAGFGELSARAAQELLDAGVRRGPARAIAHVGVELLLDGWLAEVHGVPAAYDAALALGPRLAGAIAFHAAGAAGLLEVCERVASAPHAHAAWCEPARLGSRLARILGPRPLLALERSELPAVTAWAAAARGEVARAAPALLAEVRAALSYGASREEAR